MLLLAIDVWHFSHTVAIPIHLSRCAIRAMLFDGVQWFFQALHCTQQPMLRANRTTDWLRLYDDSYENKQKTNQFD